MNKQVVHNTTVHHPLTSVRTPPPFQAQISYPAELILPVHVLGMAFCGVK